MIVRLVATGYTDNLADDDNTYNAFNLIDGGATDYECPNKSFFLGRLPSDYLATTGTTFKLQSGIGINFISSVFTNFWANLILPHVL